jgi:hypothetical protein
MMQMLQNVGIYMQLPTFSIKLNFGHLPDLEGVRRKFSCLPHHRRGAASRGQLAIRWHCQDAPPQPNFLTMSKWISILGQ